MKFYTFLLFFLVVLVILSFTTMGSCRVTPYSQDLMLTNRYENFRGQSQRPLEYTSVTDGSEMDGSRMPASAAGGCKKVMGFQGVYCAANQDPANPTDIYSQAQGSPSCASMGYSNSRGFLCMNDQQVKLLTSRGGNATGM